MAEEEQKIQHVAAQDSEQMDTEQNKVDDMTPQQQLWHFAKRGDVDKLKSLGAAGYDINATDDGDEKKSEIYKSMNTAMHYAVMSGSLETVKIIYNLEAGLETQNKFSPRSNMRYCTEQSSPFTLRFTVKWTVTVHVLLS